jgi:hypothetical protein
MNRKCPRESFADLNRAVFQEMGVLTPTQASQGWNMDYVLPLSDLDLGISVSFTIVKYIHSFSGPAIRNFKLVDPTTSSASRRCASVTAVTILSRTASI